MFILKLSWAQQLLWNVPEIVGSLCDNGTVPGAAIKDTLHYKTENRKPILWQASVKADSQNASRFRSVRMLCVHTVRRVQSPSRTARDRRPAIISIKHEAPFVF
jgi:hypothetical protein